MQFCNPSVSSSHRCSQSETGMAEVLAVLEDNGIPQASLLNVSTPNFYAP